jgi:hypothetical protein
MIDRAAQASGWSGENEMALSPNGNSDNGSKNQAAIE